MRKKGAIGLFILIGILVAIPLIYTRVTAPTQGSPIAAEHSFTDTENITISLGVTSSLGQEWHGDEGGYEVYLEHGTAMDALTQKCEVETNYGGAYVTTINGLKESSSDYWYYYINGFLADEGAGAYMLRNGDVEQWDYHAYGAPFIEATVGAFPETFVYGYNGEIYPTIVVYEDGFEGEADVVKEYLYAHAGANAGTIDVRCEPYEYLSEVQKEGCNLILIGTLSDPLVSELNGRCGELGWSAHLNDGEVVVGGQSYGSAGLIQASENPWNPSWSPSVISPCQNVVWIVTGSDEAMARKAVNKLLSPDEYRYDFAVVINNQGDVIRIP